MHTDGFDLSAYLDRIGAAPPAAASLAALQALQRAHLAAIPFENLDILLGRSIRLDLGSLHAKLVAGGRGGYCFEQNTLFQAALQALGFAVRPLAARVRVGGGPVRPRTHMLIHVALPEGGFVTDVGFGGDSPLRPLRLDEATVTRDGDTAHRLRREDGLWVLEADTGGGWTDQYAFTLEPQLPVDFEMANHFTSTWPLSRFVNSLTAQICTTERRLILRNRELVVREADGQRTSTVRDPEHLLQVLDEHFGLRFPSGTRFAKPEFGDEPASR
jgi:N-hydroxyarylamine O-acetyltransferase